MFIISKAKFLGYNSYSTSDIPTVNNSKYSISIFKCNNVLQIN